MPSIPAGAAPCRAGQVELRFRWGVPFSVALAEGTLTVRNVSRTVCVVGGPPAVKRPPGGLALRVTGPLFEPANGFWAPEGYPRSNPPWGLRPGGTARAAVLEQFPCFEAGDVSGHETIRLALGGSSVPVSIVVCVAGPAWLLVGPLVPPELPEQPPTRFPFRAEILGKPHGRTGEPLRFRIRLTNLSGRPFRFPYCPFVVEGVDGGGGAGGGTLNCHGLGALRPGSGVVFAMETDALRFFPPGRHRLRWWLENEVGATQAVAVTPFVLDP